MVYTIQNKILSILASSSSLYAGGNAYATGWTGTKLVYSGDSAIDGYVNLHKSREKSEGARPAIYLGARGIKLSDKQTTQAVNSVGVQYRQMRIPLVIVCKALNTTRPTTTAESMAEQLANNVRSILMQNRVQTEWICLKIGRAHV